MDRLIWELDERFPAELGDWKYLRPAHFGDEEAEERIRTLAARYKRFLDPEEAVNGIITI